MTGDSWNDGIASGRPEPALRKTPALDGASDPGFFETVGAKMRWVGLLQRNTLQRPER